MNIDQKWFEHERYPGIGWYSLNLQNDFRQNTEEGKDVEQYEELVNAVSKLPAGPVREDCADVLFKAMLEAPVKEGYPYLEPSDLEEIREARPKNRKDFAPVPTGDALKEKIHGAWLGRICGCLLGKPVEGLNSKVIKKIIEAAGDTKLSGYFDPTPETIKDLELAEDRCWLRCVDGMPMDDDTNYTTLAAVWILKKYGRDFKPVNVVDSWLESMPKTSYCTAEQAAYLNAAIGIVPPKSAIFRNPFREWIGAQIRADYYGYINPGDTQSAAEMAWRDATVSHVKNGIYGEMFVAAMLAAAAVSSDIKEVIQAGLQEIPEKSRLTEAIEKVLSWYESGRSAEECLDEIHTMYDEANGYDWCHTIPNAMIVAACLLYGGMDYSKSICMAVETGFDTDCNGATVGSILGMMLGAKNIPAYWTKPLNNTVHTSIAGYESVKISDLVEITLSHLK
ncbi:ADP-ribosylglycohydrolase family protein [Fumia xinanensis]|uniref:ADP-ribosylglycohydrolase family protein n=1 Tax=Fumia xinanensis TaxID=2763659 RepID=A0A926I8F7_9FIRM|nr:ADP-ribosylglycohydrolase family protein [Fumia xinanensis]MBC8560912.1 ADP-ribosylglycohydrolase family protein [Fumia xinanensis]